MSKADDYLDSINLTPKKIAKAAGCRQVLIMKYIQEGVRGTGLLFSVATNEHGQPLVRLRDLELFADFHSGYARNYALQAIRTLRGAQGTERRNNAIISS